MPILTETPLQRTSLREQALALVREALITGRIADGVVYSSKALAAELGVSNGPIREAMLALVDDGLMEAVPNKGFRTVPLTEADLAEIYEMRLLLEVPVVARLARGDLPGDRAARLTDLVNTIERTARSRDLTGNLAADRDFHLSLLAAGGNSRLVSAVARLRDQTRLHNLRTINADGGLVTSAEEHRPLLAAIMRHDERTAERLMRQHLEHIRQDWSRPAGSGLVTATTWPSRLPVPPASPHRSSRRTELWHHELSPLLPGETADRDRPPGEVEAPLPSRGQPADRLLTKMIMPVVAPWLLGCPGTAR